MKPVQLASNVAKKEGHKSQSRIGDIREIISIIADMSYKDRGVIDCIVKLGIDRAKRVKKPSPSA